MMVKLDNLNDNDIYFMFITVCGRYAVNNRIPLNEAALFAEQLTAMNKPVTSPTSLRNQLLKIGAVDTKEHLIATIKEYCEKYFCDDECGEWYGYLHYDNTVSTTLKGNIYKGPFHIPRLYIIMAMMDEFGGIEEYMK